LPNKAACFAALTLCLSTPFLGHAIGTGPYVLTGIPLWLSRALVLLEVGLPLSALHPRLRTLTLASAGCSLFDDPDRGECHGTIDGTEVSLSLDADNSEYVLEFNNDVRLQMHFTDGTTTVSVNVARLMGPPSNLPLTPQDLGTALMGLPNAWVLGWAETVRVPARGTVDLEEATLTRMHGTFEYVYANDDTLQCTFDLRRSERRSGGDADSD